MLGTPDDITPRYLVNDFRHKDSLVPCAAYNLFDAEVHSKVFMVFIDVNIPYPCSDSCYIALYLTIVFYTETCIS